MTLVDITKLKYEPFFIEDGENSEIVDYISAKDLWKAPKVDPVNHAEWVVDPVVFKYSSPLSVSARTVCSNCGYLGYVDSFPLELWDGGLKDIYKPRSTKKYCSECGCKMDLRELYEQYKLRWCADRGCSLEEVDHEHGINGECYVCFTEWYNNEYLESRGE